MNPVATTVFFYALRMDATLLATKPVVVRLADEPRVAAVCYNLLAAKLARTNPQYAAALLALATTLGLPEQYRGQIRKAAAA